VSNVDNADVPERPSSPRLLINLLVSLLAGVGIGPLAAFGLEQMDEAITNPAEVERHALAIYSSFGWSRSRPRPQQLFGGRRRHRNPNVPDE
jgi:hypothetical protein